MADQKIGGGYIEVSAKGVEQTEAEVGALEKDVYELADAYDVLEKQMEQVDAVGTRLGRANMGFDFATIKLDAGLKRAGESVRGIGVDLSKYQQQIMAGSYAMQDFAGTSGDLGMKLNSITNNLPTLLSGLGGLGMVLSNVGTVGVAVYRNWDTIAGAFQNHNPIPKLAGDIDGLRESLQKTSAELEKMDAKGYLTDAQVPLYKDLQAKEKELKDSIKVREQIENLKDQKSEEEQQVAKAFRETLKDVGPKKILEALEADIKSSENPAVKKQFETIFKRINEGGRDAFDALIEYAKSEPKKYGDLAKQLEQQLVKAMSGHGQPMDDVVKKFKEERDKNKKIAHDLTQKGEDVQRDMIEGWAKDAEKGVLEMFTVPMEEFIVRGRAGGVGAGKELAHLKDRVEAEARKMFPDLEKAFPKAFEGVVNAIVLKTRESVDKAIHQLQAVEGLTKAEAIRRLNAEGAERKQNNAEKLAHDEFATFAARNYQRMAAMNPGMAQLTPEMRRQMGEELQAQMKAAGVTGAEQVRIGKILNQTVGNPRAQQTVERAMQALHANGFDQAGALRQLPNVVRAMKQGAGGPEQAVDRILNAMAKQQAGAVNRQAAEQGRTQAVKVSGAGLANTQKLIGATANLGAEVAKQQRQVAEQAKQIGILVKATHTLQKTALKR